MSTAIFRIEKNKDNPYVMLNKFCLNDERLSWKAKGLLCYILSLPDDWKLYETELQTHAKDGKDSLKSAIKELIDTGYIERKRTRDDKGRLGNYEYIVREVPTETTPENNEEIKIENENNQNGFSDDGETKSGKSYVGKSNVGKTYDGKPATTNNNITNNNYTNKLLKSSSSNREIFQEIKKVFDNNIHPMTPIEADKIMAYVDDDGMDYRLIIRAIEIAVCNGGRNLRYIEGILKKWREANLLTVEALEAYQREVQDKKAMSKTQNKTKNIGAEDNGSRANSKTESRKSFEGYKPIQKRDEETERLMAMSEEELNKWMAENGIF